MSTMVSGHLEVCDGGQERSEEARLVGRGGAVDLRTDAGFGCLGCADCAAICDEHQPDPQVAAGSSVRITQHETVRNFVRDAFSYVIGKRSWNMMASWLLTACHSRTERFHSVDVALSAR